MFLIKEVCYEVVANHRQEVRVAYRTILRLRNVDLVLITISFIVGVLVIFLLGCPFELFFLDLELEKQ